MSDDPVAKFKALKAELNTEPCVRSDLSYHVIPAVGPLGSEIHHRLRHNRNRPTAEEMRRESERIFNQGWLAWEHTRRAGTGDLG